MPYSRRFQAVFATAVLTIACCALLPGMARADNPTTDSAPKIEAKKKHWVIMPTIGTYIPTNDKAKDTFGSSWPSIGFVMGMGIGDRIYDKFEFHLDGIMRKSNSDYVYMFPVGAAYTIRPPKMKSITPWAGASVDVYFTSVRSISNHVDTGWRPSVGGSVFAGLDLGKNLSLKASYLATPKVSSFDLSGMNLQATIGF